MNDNKINVVMDKIIIDQYVEGFRPKENGLSDFYVLIETGGRIYKSSSLNIDKDDADWIADLRKENIEMLINAIFEHEMRNM